MEFIESLYGMLCGMAPYILLGFLIAGLLHAFVSSKTMSRHLSGTGIGPVFKAAMFGVPLPLCSCGVLPSAIALHRGGASKAASTSFLIATPQTGVDSIAATWSLLGPAFAIVRPVAALVTAMFGGLAVGNVEKEPRANVSCHDSACSVDDEPQRSFLQKTTDALRYGFVDLVGSIGGWLVIGLIIAAAITVFVPDGYFTLLGNNPLLSMLVVLVVAIPMYVCATGSIPIALSLMLKGLSPGTALVLLMAGPAANFASFTLISREMGRKAALTYLGSIVVGAICFGLAVDYLLPSGWFDPVAVHASAHGESGTGLFATVCGIALAILLIAALTRNMLQNRNLKTTNISDMEKQYKITGMNCPHCRAAVEKAIAGVSGVENVSVSLSDGMAVVSGEHNPGAIVEAVEAAGFNANPL